VPGVAGTRSSRVKSSWDQPKGGTDYARKDSEAAITAAIFVVDRSTLALVLYNFWSTVTARQ
jgi:hypothetical protein